MALADKARVRSMVRSGTKVSKSLRKNYSSDVGDFRQIEDTDTAIRNVLPPPFRGGRLVEVSFGGAGQMTVAHDLGGYPKGAAVFGHNRNADVWLLEEKFVPENLRSTHCALVSNGACDFQLWFWK